MKKNTSTIIIVLLVIAQVISFYKITNLERRINQNINSISLIQDTVMNKINSIYSDVDEKLKKQASYLERVEMNLGELNKADLTIPITYTVIPKEVSSKTALSLDFNGEVLTMERNGTSFSITVFADIFSPEISPKILIFEDDIIKTEQNELLNIYNLKNELFPHFSVHLSGRSRENSQGYEITGTIRSDIKESKVSIASIEYIKARFIVKVDDSIIKDKSIDINNLDGYEINERISLKDGETCTLAIIVKDSLDLEHHFIIDTFTQGKNSQREPLFEHEKIYSQEGKLLWQQ